MKLNFLILFFSVQIGANEPLQNTDSFVMDMLRLVQSSSVLNQYVDPKNPQTDKLGPTFDPMAKMIIRDKTFDVQTRNFNQSLLDSEKGVSFLEFLLYVFSRGSGITESTAIFLDQFLSHMPSKIKRKLPCQYLPEMAPQFNKDLLSENSVIDALNKYFLWLPYSAFKYKRYNCFSFFKSDKKYFRALDAYLRNLAKYDETTKRLSDTLAHSNLKSLPKLKRIQVEDKFQAAFYTSAGKMVEKLKSFSEIKDFIITARKLNLVLNIEPEFRQKFKELGPRITGKAIQRFKEVGRKVSKMKGFINLNRKIRSSELAEVPARDFFKLKSITGQKLTVLTLEEAILLFELAMKDKKINFKGVHGGCQHRAVAMTKIFNSNGVVNGKIFTYGAQNPAGIKVSSSNFQNLNDLGSGSSPVAWWYHVAPLILVKIETGIEPFVIDPSLHQSPVPVEVWIQRQTRLGDSKVHSIEVESRNKMDPYNKLRKDECYSDT